MTEAFKNTVAKENKSHCRRDELWVTRWEQITTNDIWYTFKSLLSGDGHKYESFIACVNFRQVGLCCLLLAFEFIRFWGTFNGIEIRFLLTVMGSLRLRYEKNIIMTFQEDLSLSHWLVIFPAPQQIFVSKFLTIGIWLETGFQLTRFGRLHFNVLFQLSFALKSTLFFKKQIVFARRLLTTTAFDSNCLVTFSSVS